MLDLFRTDSRQINYFLRKYFFIIDKPESTSTFKKVISIYLYQDFFYFHLKQTDSFLYYPRFIK